MESFLPFISPMTSDRRFLDAILVLAIVPMLFATKANAQVAPIQYSQVWGINGSTWNRAVLRDFSKIGYHQGDAAIPSWATGVNVTSYGAVGNGTTDCTAAFNSALAACPANKAVFVPNGTYLISGYVTLAKNNTVLRGESRDGAIIKIDTNLTAKYGGDYNFGGGFLQFGGGSERGMENLTIKFPPTPYAGHFNEIGQNGFTFGGATNSRLRNIRLINVDYGVQLNGSYNSVLDVQFDAETGRTANGSTGHHGVDCYGDNNLVRGFRFNCDVLHELSHEANATDNVFCSGSGVNVVLDNHTNQGAEDPVRNLFSDIDCGSGSPYICNATTTEPENSSSTGTTMGTVYWNIRSAANQPVAKWLRTVSVGIKTADATAQQWTGTFGNLWSGPLTDYWHEKITPANLSPQDIYSAQLAYRQANPAPVVTFTSSSSVTPVAALPQSTSLTVTVTAVGANSTAISSVDLYLDDQLIARKTAAPYTWTVADSALMADLPSGSYYFSAIATDALGRFGTNVQQVNINMPSGSGVSPREIHTDERIYQTSRATGPGTYVLTGAGRDFQAYIDEGAILSRTIASTGTTTLVTRVDGFPTSGGKAGLMFRGSSGRPGGQPMTLLTVNANGTSGLLYQVRATGNGSPTTVKTIANIAAPIWLKLERNGTTHTASYSTNGTTWTAVGSTTVDLGSSINGGIAFTPRNYRTVGRANFSQTSFGATLAAPGTPTAAANSGGVTLGWAPAWEATSYQLQRATSSAGPFTTIATSVDATTFTDAVVTSGTTYYYKVQGVRLGVVGPDSGVKSITATSTPPPPPLGGLPSPWQDVDIGTVGTTGGTTYANQAFAVSGAGSDVGGVGDSFNFTYAPIAGDHALIARLTSRSLSGSGKDKIGLMIRENTTSGSKCFGILLDTGATDKVRLFYRDAAGASAKYPTDLSAITLPYWLKVQRIGNVFQAFLSPDGTSWTQVGADVTFSMSPSASFGLVVCSRSTTALARATFDNVSTPLPPLVVTINTPAANANLVQGDDLVVNASATGGVISNLHLTVNDNPMHQENTAPYDWSGTSDAALADLAAGLYDLEVTATGTDGNTGAATRQIAVGLADGSGLQLTELGSLIQHFTVRATAPGAYEVRAAGADLWGTADEGGIVSKALTGDAVALVKVESVENVNSFSKAGLTVRDSANPNAATVVLVATPANGVRFQVRPTTGAASTSTFVAGVGTPVWLRLSRQGNVFTGAYSTNGTSWTSTGTKTATMGATNLAGVAVTSHDVEQSGTASFSGLSVALASSFEGWRLQTFRPVDLNNSAISGAAADPDKDGISNAAEFYADLNPYLADAQAAAPVLGGTTAPGSVSLQFRQRKDAGGATRAFMSSVDLIRWTPANPTEILLLQDFGASARYEARFTTTGDRTFFRVEYQP